MTSPRIFHLDVNSSETHLATFSYLKCKCLYLLNDTWVRGIYFHGIWWILPYCWFYSRIQIAASAWASSLCFRFYLFSSTKQAMFGGFAWLVASQAESLWFKKIWHPTNLWPRKSWKLSRVSCNNFFSHHMIAKAYRSVKDLYCNCAAVWSGILLALFSCVHLNDCNQNLCTCSSDILISLSSLIIVIVLKSHQLKGIYCNMLSKKSVNKLWGQVICWEKVPTQKE